MSSMACSAKWTAPGTTRALTESGGPRPLARSANLGIRPRIDRLVNKEIAGTLATADGDPVLTSIHFSLDEDARCHQERAEALLKAPGSSVSPHLFG